MSDQANHDEADRLEAPEPAGDLDLDHQAPLRTGNDRVDRVLDSLDAVEGQPAEAHVPVFERAHDELRRALDDVGDDTGADIGDAAVDAAGDGGTDG